MYSFVQGPLIIVLLRVSRIDYVYASLYSDDNTSSSNCPLFNTCCTIFSQDGVSYTGCIPHSQASPGPGECCQDHVQIRSKPFLRIYGTGCATGSRCASSLDFNNTPLYYCEDLNDGGRAMTRKRQPRYILTPSSSTIVGTVYGFPIDRNDSHVAAYYSNYGSILSLSNETMSTIRVVLVVIHGSGRNADDYMSVGMTMTQLQEKFLPNEILVLAPRFLAPEDGPVKVRIYDPKSPNEIVNLTEPMRWDDFNPIEHTWRYGANALPPSSHLTSFDVIDAFIKHFTTDANDGVSAYKNLELIAVMGHSAGGQYVQRWALLSDVHGWRRILPHIRVIVANPRSYAYLDSRRFTNHTFGIPPEAMIEKCPGYNQWEWGLEHGGYLISSYKDRILAKFNTSFLAKRYALRDVIYLSGLEDTEILHGSCEDDDFQGLHRRQRSFLFFKGLSYLRNVHFSHQRIVVQGVGHDHALMFESDAAIYGVFEDVPYISSSVFYK
jgi:hypothetical protein